MRWMPFFMWHQWYTDSMFECLHCHSIPDITIYADQPTTMIAHVPFMRSSSTLVVRGTTSPDIGGLDGDASCVHGESASMS